MATAPISHDERPERPLPDPADPLFTPHFTALADGRLLVQICDDCGHVQWPPRDLCLRCRRTGLGWTDVPSHGVVYTYTVSHRAFHPGFSHALPSAVAVVEVRPGIRLLGEFDGDSASLRCDLPVVSRPRRVGDIGILVWQPGPEQ